MRAPQGLTKRALGGMAWTMSGTGVQALVQLLVIMALGRLLTPAQFGLMGAAIVVVAISQIVSHIGVGPAIIQRQQLEPIHLRTAFTLSAGMGMLLGILVWISAPALAAFYRMPAVEPVFRGVALLFPIDGLNTVGKSILIRELRFRLFVALDVGSYIVGYACIGVLLAWQGFGVWALVAAQIGQVTLSSLAMYAATRHPVRPSLNLRASRDLLSYGFGHSLGQIGTVLSQQADNMVVGRWLGAAALGVYGRAYSLMVMPATVFGKTVNRVLFPVMAQVQNEPERLGGAYERALAIVALISLPVSVCLWVIAPEFILVVLGPAWGEVVLPFRLFTISLLFRMSSKISDACTKAAGAVYSRALLQGIFAVLVFLGAVIGQQWGIGGVAVAVSIAMGINWIAMAALGRSVTDVTWSQFIRAQVPGVLLALVIGVSVALTVETARALGLGRILVVLTAAFTVGVVTWAAYRLQPKLFLGPHGVWAIRRAEDFMRRSPLWLGRAAREDRLAKANTK